MDSIYGNGSVPMITWEPWQNMFQNSAIKSESGKDEKVFAKITAGNYDSYLIKFATQIQSLNRPVYIRFAHEADNPFYPWSASGKNTSAEFKAAWKYVYEVFQKQGAHNAIWVWNQWKADAMSAYFPGKNYVDWIGFTNLNYSSQGSDKKWYSMEQLYTPFHQNAISRSGIPDMLAEMGSLRSEGRQEEWFKNASHSIKNKFHEIKAFVLFNSNLDQNLPKGYTGSYLDWTVANPKNIFKLSNIKKDIQPVSYLKTDSLPVLKFTPHSIPFKKNFEGIKGINYTKGLNWSENFNILRNKKILSDFEEIKSMGFNTIKRFGPGAFDQAIFSAARRSDLNIHYSFYIPDPFNFLKDQSEFDKLSETIIKTVANFKGNKEITIWNISNLPIQKFDDYYYKPELLYHQYDYVSWLRNLIRKIKAEDPSRPVTIDLEVKDDRVELATFLKTQIPEIDLIGLIINDQTAETESFDQLNFPFYISRINALKYLDRPKEKAGFFIADWQDQQKSDLVTFDGLKDNWGRSKVTLYRLKNRLLNNTSKNHLPRVKILRPAFTINPNSVFTYHALIEVNNQWKLANTLKSRMEIDWYLIKTDQFGNGISMKYLNSGPELTFKVPKEPWNYKLYLNAHAGNEATTANSILNIPFIAPDAKK